MKPNKDDESKSTSRNKGGKPGRRNKNRRSNKPKEAELNIDRDDLNRADLPGKGPDNDFGWYNKYPELVKSVAQFSYGIATGRRVSSMEWQSYPVETYNNLSVTTSILSVPGIMAIQYAPIIGNTLEGATSAINLEAYTLESYQRSRNSRTKTYDAANLMMHIEACKSIISLFWYGVRAYGALNMSSPFNAYTPGALITAMGFDYDDLLTNKTQFRNALNQMAIDFNKIKIPKGMAAFDRVVWLNSNVFTDSNTAKAQFYLFKPQCVYRFTEAVTGPNYLQYKSITDYTGSTSTPITVSTFRQIVRDLMVPMLESENIGDITADIMRAYGVENCLILPQIAEDYVTVPGYSAEVLSEIENATLVGPLYENTTFYAAEDMQGRTNLDICEVIPEDAALGSPYLNQIIMSRMYADTDTQIEMLGKKFANAVFANGKTTINMHKQDVQFEDTVIATRLTAKPDMATINPTGSSSGYCSYKQLGTEICTFATIYSFTNVTGTGWNVAKTLLRSVITSTTTTTNTWVWMKTAATQISRYIAFDWAPKVALALWDPANATEDSAAMYYTPFCDYDNYVVLTSDEIGAINDACLRSLYKVDQISTLAAKPR